MFTFVANGIFSILSRILNQENMFQVSEKSVGKDIFD